MERQREFPGFGYALLLVVAALALMIGLVIPVAVVDALLKTKWVEQPGVMACISLVATGSVIVVGALFTRAPFREVFPLKPVRPALALPVILSILGTSILLSEADNWVRYLMPMPRWLEKIFVDLVTAKHGFWGSFCELAVVAPLTEELLFRGLILRGFLSRYSTLTAVVVSSILFALMHLNPWQMTTALVLGLQFGWWFVRTRSLLPCLAGHALANGCILCSSFLPFHISGFNLNSPQGALAEFQPFWFDLIGVALLAAGAWLFAAWTRQPPSPAPPSSSSIPVS